MKSLILFIVVEDKLEEQLAAEQAIRQALGQVEETSIPKMTFFPDSPMLGIKFKNELGEGAAMLLFAADLEVAENKFAFAKKVCPNPKQANSQVIVLTDLMFPAKHGGKEEPNGLSVIAMSIEAGFPVAVCSDVDHHAVSWLRPILPILGKAHPSGDIPVILDRKDWEKAVAAVFS